MIIAVLRGAGNEQEEREKYDEGNDEKKGRKTEIICETESV